MVYPTDLWPMWPIKYWWPISPMKYCQLCDVVRLWQWSLVSQTIYRKRADWWMEISDSSRSLAFECSQHALTSQSSTAVAHCILLLPTELVWGWMAWLAVDRPEKWTRALWLTVCDARGAQRNPIGHADRRQIGRQLSMERLRQTVAELSIDEVISDLRRSSVAKRCN